MYHLENLKIEYTDVFTPPRSEALFEDVYSNMDIFDKWLYDLIDGADFNDDFYKLFGEYVPTAGLHEKFEKYVENTRKVGVYIKASKVATVTKLTQELKNTYGFIYKKYRGSNCIFIPSISEAKQIFEANYTCKVVWSKPENPIHEFIETPKQQKTVLEPSQMTEEEKLFYECSKIGKVI